MVSETSVLERLAIVEEKLDAVMDLLLELTKVLVKQDFADSDESIRRDASPSELDEYIHLGEPYSDEDDEDDEYDLNETVDPIAILDTKMRIDATFGGHGHDCSWIVDLRNETDRRVEFDLQVQLLDDDGFERALDYVSAVRLTAKQTKRITGRVMIGEANVADAIRSVNATAVIA